MELLLRLDGNFLLFIQNHLRKDFLSLLMKFITTLGDDGWIWIMICLILLLFKKTRYAGVLGLFSLAVCFLITNIGLKNIIERPRPYTEIPGLTILIEPLTSFSFPSGHTANSFACAFSLKKMLPRKYGKYFIILAFLIGFSRLYLGVHYPTDVIGGIIVGWLSSKIVLTIYRKIRFRKPKKKEE